MELLNKHIEIAEKSLKIMKCSDTIINKLKQKHSGAVLLNKMIDLENTMIDFENSGDSHTNILCQYYDDNKCYREYDKITKCLLDCNHYDSIDKLFKE